MSEQTTLIQMTKSKSTPWWVYIIETEKGTFYTGISTDPERRLQQHSGKIKGGAKFFNSTLPKKICFKKKFLNRSEASKFEYLVKKLKRSQKILLIQKKKL